MKHEWKKNEKKYYLPKNKPELIQLPAFKFFTIKGEGNPNDDFFSEYISVLYSLSYAVKMSPKKAMGPAGYFEYSVYPLEGIWSLNESAKKSYNGTINKNDLVFKLMIRQPEFVDEPFASRITDYVKKKNPHALLNSVKFEEITDGDCIQMLHEGSYDSEPESFKMMTQYAEQIKYTRTHKDHREIYLSDSRKVSPDKLKTVLRFCVRFT